MIDIHCHILPGIDDGPDDLAGAVTMARAATESGIATVVATPHLRQDFPKVKIDEVAGRVEDLRRVLAAEGIDLRLVAGGEVSVTWALDADDAALELASYGQMGRYVLIETPTSGGRILGNLLAQISSRGYRVVLAHPERLGDFQRKPELVEDLRARGILLQVNAESLLRPARQSSTAALAQQIVRDGLAAAVASDGHRGERWRPITHLAETRPWLATVGATCAQVLLDQAPAAIIAGNAV